MSGPATRAWMLIPASPERFDGIRDFARKLAEALAADQRVECLTVAGDAGETGALRVLDDWRALRAERDRPDVVYVNYLPTSWLRRDTPHLLSTLRRVRRAGTRVIVVIHEYQVDSNGSPRRALVRAVFRKLARAFARRADALVVTHPLIERRLTHDRTNRLAPIACIPVGSNIPRVPRRAGDPAADVVMFGQPSSMDAAMVASLAAAIVQAGRSPIRWLCRDASELRRWLTAAGIPLEHIVTLAGLDATEASAELGRASVAFAPIADGVSTRRGTISAFLQHALPIVGITGPATDALLADSGAFALVPRRDVADATAAVFALLDDPARRARLSAAAARLFDARLSWSHIGRQYLELAK